MQLLYGIQTHTHTHIYNSLRKNLKQFDGLRWYIFIRVFLDFFSGQFCLLFIIYPFIFNESKLVISWKFVLNGVSRHDHTDDGGH